MTTTKLRFTAAVAAVLLVAVGAAAQAIIDLAPIVKGEVMPEPEKRPPALPARKVQRKVRGDVHENGEALQKRIAKTYRDDHPAFDIARAAAMRQKGGK